MEKIAFFLFIPVFVYVALSWVRAFIKWNTRKMYDLRTWSEGARAVFVFTSIILVIAAAMALNQ